MLCVISPSKTLDFEGRPYQDHTIPFFTDQVQILIDHMKTLTAKDLESLMKISPKLSKLNYQRYQNFSLPFTLENSRQALPAFKGDVYQGIEVDQYTKEDFAFAQDHLRILSGLYGLLRPLDLMQPYRLEMGTRLAGTWGKNLYEFWGEQITLRLDRDIKACKGRAVLVNLASNEYVKAVKPKTLEAGQINILFKEKKADAFKVIGIYAKKARGLMVNYIIRNRIVEPEELQNFTRSGYAFNPDLSSEQDWVFSR